MARKKKTKNKTSKEFLENLGETYSKRLKEEATKWEKILYDYLEEGGYSFDFQVPVVVELKKYNKLYILDFLLKDYNLVIEVDSIRYHGTKEQIKSDNKRTKNLEKIGYTVMRIYNSQIENLKKELLMEAIETKIKLLKTVKK